jgi:hypothetical protein
MFSVLGEILKGIEDFPQLVLAGLVDAINGLLAALATTINAVIAVLPSMPSIPGVPQGDYLGWLNWLYPVGQAVDILSAALTMYVLWLAVRYLFSLLRFGES